MWQQNNENQTPNFDTYNVSNSCLWNRNIPLSSMPPQQNISFANPTMSIVPMSIEQRISMHFGQTFAQDLVSLNRDHDVGVDAMLNNQKNMLLLEIAEKRQKYSISLCGIIEKNTSKRIKEKDVELEKTRKINSELNNKISQLCSQNQSLSNHAKQNAALTSKIKKRLQDVIVQNGTSCPVSSAQSCFNMENTREKNNDKFYRRMLCIVCHENEISCLVLNCRHLCICEECEKKLEVCPVCNCSKEGSIQVIMP